MKLRGLNDYDICNYKKPCMFLIFPYCNFKCDHEANTNVCQNSTLAHEPIIEVEPTELIMRYLENPLTHAVVCGGLEPLDSQEDLLQFITLFRGFSNDDIIIYTGYKESEVQDFIKMLQKFNNIIVKFGRFIPDSPHIYDPILGVELASDNQYALEIHNEYISNYGGEGENE